MGRLFFAIKTFFRMLGSAELTEGIKHLPDLSGGKSTEVAATTKATSQPQVKPPQKITEPPKRSDALTLLETLQREARLLDFIYEDIAEYSDAQVGGAVREIHRGTKTVLDRLFGVSPIETAEEGSQQEVQDQSDSARLRLVGNVTDTRPITGELVHAGWQATRCELPQWQGSPDNQNILAPAEVEIR